MDDNQDHFNVMREIQKHPKTSQRDLAQNLGFSLGKLNYCLKALQQKGLIKMKNFENNIEKQMEKTVIAGRKKRLAEANPFEKSFCLRTKNALFLRLLVRTERHCSTSQRRAETFSRTMQLAVPRVRYV